MLLYYSTTCLCTLVHRCTDSCNVDIVGAVQYADPFFVSRAHPSGTQKVFLDVGANKVLSGLANATRRDATRRASERNGWFGLGLTDARMRIALLSVN